MCGLNMRVSSRLTQKNKYRGFEMKRYGARRKKDELIPLEKQKKVIYVERRVRKSGWNAGAVVLAILAVLCMLYCLSIFFFMGYGTKFFLIWGVIAVVFGGLAYFMAHEEWKEKIPRWLKRCFLLCVTAGVLCFVGVEGLILSQWNAKATPGADYMIVLGAQWKSNGPGYMLQKRLDKAAAYLAENPDTLVIVSVGKGANEPISEAEGMKGYLMEQGIAKERILMEDASTNTRENLAYSAEFLDRGQHKVVLVTNNFHMFRALRIAEKQGYEQIEGLSAASYPGMVPNNLLRECLGVVKDCLAGNM